MFLILQRFLNIDKVLNYALQQAPRRLKLVHIPSPTNIITSTQFSDLVISISSYVIFFA